MRNPLFTTLAIIFPIIVVTVFFLLIYYTSKEINDNNNQGVYIDKTSSADTDPVLSALVETKMIQALTKRMRLMMRRKERC